MFNLLKNIYSKARGFRIDDGYLPTNYKFFILALKAFAVTNEAMTVMYCLSLLMSILEISMKQYNDLYKHVDRLANEPIPNYLCYSCNYAEYGLISCLSKHVQSEEHCKSVARLANDSNEYLFCSGCGKFFNSDSIMVHADHFLEDRTNEAEYMDEEDEDDEVDKPVAKKRRVMEDIVDKYRNDLKKYDCKITKVTGADELDDPDDPEGTIEIEDAVELDDDSDKDPDYDTKEDGKNEEDNEEEEEFHEIEDNLSEDEHNESKDSDSDDHENELENNDNKGEKDVQYYYFCLDCEEEHSGPHKKSKQLKSTRYPISMDIAEHMTKKKHTNFVPIKNLVGVQIQNLSFNQEMHKTVIKKWKQLVKDGDITDVSYSQPRKCKCGLHFSDAIDMFKHIKDVHIKSKSEEQK